MLVMTWVQPKSMGFWNAGFLEGERSVDHSWVACAYSCVMVSLARFLLLVVVAAAQKLVPFDGAAASSQYSSHSFAADLALGESSGWRLLVACASIARWVKTPVLDRYWCSAGSVSISHCRRPLCLCRAFSVCAGTMRQVRLCRGQVRFHRAESCWG